MEIFHAGVPMVHPARSPRSVLRSDGHAQSSNRPTIHLDPFQRQPPRNTLKESSSVSCPKLEDAKGRPVDTSDEGLLPPGCLFELLPFRTSASAGQTRVVEPPCGMGVGSFLLSPSGGGLWQPLFFLAASALACAAVEQLSPELILLWWVNRELDGAMIDLGAAISGGMKRT